MKSETKDSPDLGQPGSGGKDGNVQRSGALAPHAVAPDQDASYQALFINAQAVSLLIDPRDGRIVDANKAAQAFYGYDHATLRGLNISAINRLSPAELALEMNLARKEARSHFLFRHRLASGEVRDVEVRSGPVTLEGREFLLSTVHDVTDRQQNENALLKSGEWLRAIAEHAPGVITLKDIEGRYLFVNQRFAARRGRPVAEIIGKRGDDVFPADQAEHYGAQDRAVLEARKPMVWEDVVEGTDGGSVNFVIERFPVFGDDGEIVAIGAIATDASDRIRAETGQKDQAALTEALIDAVPAPVFYKDTDHIYLGCNPAFAAFLGLGHDEIVGKTVDDIAPPDLARVYRDADDALARQGGTQIYETQVLYADGTRHDVMFHKAVFHKSDGSAGGIIGIMLDITESKQREELLRRTQKMRAIGQLTGGIAHDFNNLLAVMLSSLELVQDELSESDKNHALLGRAIRAGESGAALTRQLLAFSRQQILKPVSLDLNGLLAGMNGLLVQTLGEVIQVETSLTEGLWPTVVDPSQTENAILNLCINARDAMPAGGTLRIETRNQTFRDPEQATLLGIEPGEFVTVTITDTGKGMSPEVMDQVFEPFFTTKEVGAGTGLGLSMVYGFIRQSNGHVTVRSREGVGTAITFYLPRSHKAVEPAAPRPTDMPAGRNELVLLVEDNADLRALALSVLGSLGYRVLEAAEGSSALKRLAEEGPVDLLLTDIILPGGMDGREIARRATAAQPGLPVLYMSGYSEEIGSDDASADAGVELLKKPFRRAELARRVRAALKRAAPA